MQGNRQTNIKNIKMQNQMLEEQNKKMEAQLQKVRKLKQIENQKLRLKKELQSLNLAEEQEIPEIKPKVEMTEEKAAHLRAYAAYVVKKQDEAKKPIPKFKVISSSSSDDEDDNGQNVKDFLKLLGMQKYFEGFLKMKIKSLSKLRYMKEKQFKQMNIPIGDLVKINKKLRQMGF